MPQDGQYMASPVKASQDLKVRVILPPHDLLRQTFPSVEETDRQRAGLRTKRLTGLFPAVTESGRRDSSRQQ